MFTLAELEHAQSSKPAKNYNQYVVKHLGERKNDGKAYKCVVCMELKSLNTGNGLQNVVRHMVGCF